MKKEIEEDELVREYLNWRKLQGELINDGLLTERGVDCGEGSVREDFSRFAELPSVIGFNEMKILEDWHDKELIRQVDLIVVMLEEKNAELIFDNGGGLTMKLNNEYAHYYGADEFDQASNDLVAYVRGADVRKYEGHEMESLALTPTYDEIANGGYRECHAEDLIGVDRDTSWGNIDDFAKIINKFVEREARHEMIKEIVVSISDKEHQRAVESEKMITDDYRTLGEEYQRQSKMGLSDREIVKDFIEKGTGEKEIIRTVQMYSENVDNDSSKAIIDARKIVKEAQNEMSVHVKTKNKEMER